jgi:hypothetical protein
LCFPERMLTFDCSRYAPPAAPDPSIPERCLPVILTANVFSVVFELKTRRRDIDDRRKSFF